MNYEIVHEEDKLLKPLTVVEQKIVSMYSDGVNIKDIAIEIGVDISAIRRILNKPDIKKITNDLIMSYGNTVKAEKLRIISSIIDDKLKKVEEKVDEEGNHIGRMADITNKDVVDLLQTMDNMQREQEKADLGTTQNNVYVQLLNNIMD